MKARDFRRGMGDTPSLTITAGPTRSRPLGAAQLRDRVPYDSEDKGLRFHDVPEALNGDWDGHRCRRSDEALSTTGVDVVLRWRLHSVPQTRLAHG